MGTHPIFESDFDCLTDNMDTSKAQKLKEQDLAKQLRAIRELQVAQYELESSKRQIYEQVASTNVFLISSKHEQDRRVKRQLKKSVEQFKVERVGSSFEHERINL